MGFFQFKRPVASFFPRDPGRGEGIGAAKARQQVAYDVWELDVSVVRASSNPHAKKFTGDVLGVLEFQSAPAVPDVWVRFDGGKWIRVKPAFVWEQPFKLIEVYVGTAIAGGRLDLALQQTGRLEADL